MLRQLKHTPDIVQEYDTVIKTQAKQGTVELVEDSESSNVPGMHYLPHHAVIRQDKTTTNRRVVYDASTKTSDLLLLNASILDPNSIKESSTFLVASEYIESLSPQILRRLFS